MSLTLLQRFSLDLTAESSLLYVTYQSTPRPRNGHWPQNSDVTDVIFKAEILVNASEFEALFFTIFFAVSFPDIWHMLHFTNTAFIIKL